MNDVEFRTTIDGSEIRIIVERGSRNCSAYSPDVPGCIATGKTVEETKRLMLEALEYHLHGFPDDDLTVHYPSPTTKEMPANMHV